MLDNKELELSPQPRDVAQIGKRRLVFNKRRVSPGDFSLARLVPQPSAAQMREGRGTGHVRQNHLP